MSMATQLDKDAWKDGHAVRQEGKGLAFNPYVTGTGASSDWQRGWRAAHQALGAGDQMNSQQLEDQAAEARDEAAEQTEALDQREADLSGRIEDLETECEELRTKRDAALAALNIGPVFFSSFDAELAEAQRENRLLAEKLERWNEVEKNACRALVECLSGIAKALDTFKDSPGDW